MTSLGFSHWLAFYRPQVPCERATPSWVGKIRWFRGEKLILDFGYVWQRLLRWANFFLFILFIVIYQIAEYLNPDINRRKQIIATEQFNCCVGGKTVSACPLTKSAETDYRNSMIMTTASFARFEERHINTIILARTDESEKDREMR